MQDLYREQYESLEPEGMLESCDGSAQFCIRHGLPNPWVDN